jgi:phosphatidylserine/phosphatidylglycerophosphate/cardiolipin synthase-like enzyme
MRAQASQGSLTVQAIAGAHTVLLGFDLDDPTGCLGFGIRRQDHMEDEVYWLRGMKRFASLVPSALPGQDFSLRDHPLQGFQWGDYSAKPEHEYTYKVVALGGEPGNLTELDEAALNVRTEAEDDGVHGIWFNRGVAGSQAFVKRFGHYTPPVNTSEDHPAFAWLSRGLGEAFVRFVERATDASWGLRGAFYEFTWHTGLRAFADAAARGVDLSLVVHGRDRDPEGGDDKDRTAADNREAVTAIGLNPCVVWRTAPNKSALQHNKFLVLTHLDAPVAVWTGSTNLTQGAIFGHLNVGHIIGDSTVAGQFLDYWAQLADQANATTTLRGWVEGHNSVDLTAQPAKGMTTILSPRTTTSTLLDWYATIFDGCQSSAHITGAFGINKVFREKLAVDRDVVRTVLLDQKPRANAPIDTDDDDVRMSWGDYLHRPVFDQWAEEHLTNFNRWVKFIHTKIILVDPLTSMPTIITGSANYSDNSTTDNEENSILICGDDDAAKRVADIYLTEYQRLFMHFVYRDWANRDPDEVDTDTDPTRLLEDSSWSDRYYLPGSWRARQRHLFAGTE